MSPTNFKARPITRRRLLEVGGLGMVGLGLPEFLRASSQRPGQRRGSVKSCIFVVLWGGASHIDTWDPKPGAPSEIRGPYRPIVTSAPGIQISELQPGLARVADRCCLIRSMTHTEVRHEEGLEICLTGH